MIKGWPTFILPELKIVKLLCIGRIIVILAGGENVLYLYTLVFWTKYLFMWIGKMISSQQYKPDSNLKVKLRLEVVSETKLKFTKHWDFPGGLVVKTPCFHCKGHRFNACLGN